MLSRVGGQQIAPRDNLTLWITGAAFKSQARLEQSTYV